MNLKQRLEAIPVQEIVVCSIVKAELCFGAMKSANPERNFALQQKFLAQFVSLPFDDLAATTFGLIRLKLETQGSPIGAYDLQIAAIALANHLTLAKLAEAPHRLVERGRDECERVDDTSLNELRSNSEGKMEETSKLIQ